MPVVTKAVSNPGISTQTPCMGHFYHPFPVGEAIAAVTPCYFAADGTIRKSTGAANAPAPTNQVDGWCMEDAAVGQNVCLVKDVDVEYGSGMTPGSSLYLDGTTAGALNTAATANGQQAGVATVLPDGKRLRLGTTR